MANAQTLQNRQHCAECEAMERQRAFSWIVSIPRLSVRRFDVQKGVYVKHTQKHFHTYMMK